MRLARLIALVVLVWCPPAWAEGPHGVDVPAMVAAADLIVVGRATNTVFHLSKTPSDEPQPFIETARLSIERTILVHGIAGPSNAIAIRLKLIHSDATSGPITPEGVRDRQYGMYFLKKSRDGVFEPTDPYYPALFASHQPALATSGPTNPLINIAKELARIYDVPVETLERQYPGLHYTYLETTFALDSVPHDITRDIFRRLATSARLSTRLWATRSLLEMGDAEYLAPIAPELLDPPANQSNGVWQVAFGISGLASLVAHGSQKPDLPFGTVGVLSKLLTSKSHDVRRGAADLLRTIADTTDTAIRPLGLIALNDEERDVRYFAVFGLCRANARTGVSTYQQYCSDNDQSLKFWRKWVNDNIADGSVAPTAASHHK